MPRLQPLDKLEWVPREDLRANTWNPNHVAPPELELLAQSILADGWTQPIVARPDGEIVDGFHRWTVSARPDVSALTAGLVPVVRIDADPAHLRASTVRHNRARGTHVVLRMADLVAEMVELGASPDEVRAAMGMDPEEVKRLLDRGQMIKRGAAGELHKGWVPR